MTTAPNELCAELYNRMPVVLNPAAWPAWLGEEPTDAPQLKALLALCPAEAMVEWPGSPRVGNVNSRDDVLAMTIPLPEVAGAKPPWPRELHGHALDRFKEAGNNP